MFARIFLLFIIVPLIELFLFLVIGRYIGILPTFGIILLTGILGAALARTQGMRALAKYQQAIAEGRLPHEAVIDGLLILVAEPSSSPRVSHRHDRIPSPRPARPNPGAGASRGFPAPAFPRREHGRGRFIPVHDDGWRECKRDQRRSRGGRIDPLARRLRSSLNPVTRAACGVSPWTGRPSKDRIRDRRVS